jgi:hypothetical protein
VPSRRLEDCIRYVCSLAIVAKSDDVWLILSELRTLIHEQIQRVRAVAADKVSCTEEFFERRCNVSPTRNYPNGTTASVSAVSTP